MKRTFVLTVLPLVSSTSLAAAFVCPAPARATTSAAFTPNRPRLAGDASSAAAAIAPLRPLHDQHQQRRSGRHLVASLGGGVPEVAAVVVSSTSSAVSWLVGALVAASIANFLQGRPYRDLGLTPDKILGVPAEEATADHVAGLGAWLPCCAVAAVLPFLCVRSDAVLRLCSLLIMKFNAASPELQPPVEVLYAV